MAKKLEVRVVQLEDGQKGIMGLLSKMDAKLDGLDHIIRGNGAPGLNTKISLQDQRLQELEKLRKGWKEFMILCVSGGLVSVLTAAVQHFIR